MTQSSPDPVPGASGTAPLEAPHLPPKGLQSQAGRQELSLSSGAWKEAQTQVPTSPPGRGHCTVASGSMHRPRGTASSTGHAEKSRGGRRQAGTDLGDGSGWGSFLQTEAEDVRSRPSGWTPRAPWGPKEAGPGGTANPEGVTRSFETEGAMAPCLWTLGLISITNINKL